MVLRVVAAWLTTGLVASLCLSAHHRPSFLTDSTPLSQTQLEALVRHSRRQLSASELAVWRRTGVVHVPDVLPASVAHELGALFARKPPAASPKLRGVLLFAANMVWLTHTAARSVSFSGLTSSLAAQLLAAGTDGSSRDLGGSHLLNSIVYGVGAGQPGAGWHVDTQSFSPTNGTGLSVWIALQPVAEVPLRFACRHAVATAAGCALDARGLPPPSDTNATRRRSCQRLLDEAAAARVGDPVGPMRAGDAIVFSSEMVHRTHATGHDAPLRLRRSYTERWAADGATVADDHAPLGRAVANIREQPYCVHGLRLGERLSGPCFPLVPESMLTRPGLSDGAARTPSLEGGGAAADEAAAPWLLGVSVLPRAVLMMASAASGLRADGGASTIWRWWRLFAWTQVRWGCSMQQARAGAASLLPGSASSLGSHGAHACSRRMRGGSA